MDLPPPDSEIVRECCLCYDTEKPALQDEEGHLVSITEYPVMVPDDVLFLGPCRRHMTCKECLVQVLGSREPSFLGPHRIRVPCLAAGQTCTNVVGSQYFYSDSEISKIVSADLYQFYLSEVERYSLPGYELVPCPNCQCRVPIPSKDIEARGYDNAVFICTQNRNCQARFCYHCNTLQAIGSQFCQLCSGYDNGQHPRSLNHYFYKPQRQPGEREPALWRNNELTLELVLAQLKEIAVVQKNSFMEHGQKVSSVHALRCFGCLQGFIKTELCNSVVHCGISHCYVCNFSMSGRDQEIPLQHWNECPRFENAGRWSEILGIDFPCRSGYCYSHDLGECKVAAHRPALKKLHAWRRNLQVTKAFESLLPELQTEVVEFLRPKPVGYARLRQILVKRL